MLRALAICGLLVAASILPLLSGTAYAAVNLNFWAVEAKFTIPGAPLTRTTVAMNSTQQCSAGAPCTLTVGSTVDPVTLVDAFPPSGQLLVSDGAWGDGDKSGAEILTYNSKTATSFSIVQRGPNKVPTSPKVAHPIGSKVKLATVTQTAITGTNGAQSNLLDGNVADASTTDMLSTAGGCTAVAGESFALAPGTTPFLIELSSITNFPSTGFVTISHQDKQTANQVGVGPAAGSPVGGISTEFMSYDMLGGATGNQIRITARGLQPTNRCYPHIADLFLQPHQLVTPAGLQPSGRSKVSVHFQAVVKSNAGFFPAGNLLVCDMTSPLTNCELMGHNNVATQIKTPATNELHITDRCADASTLNKAPGGSGPCTFPVHAANTTIVTGADTFMHCRSGIQQPGVDGNLNSSDGVQEPTQQVAATSVGVTAVCYAESQPEGDGPNKPPVIIGQDLNVWNSIAGQPFLSTGGFCHAFLGAVDANPSTAPNCVSDGNCGDAVTNDSDPLVNEGCPKVGATAETGTQCTNATEDDGDGAGAINDGCPLAYQAEPFDTDGPKGDANDCDMDGSTAEIVLCLVSPCITDFTPGTNLKLEVRPLAGTIRVVVDTITGPGGGTDGNVATHDDCDDPASTDVFTSTVYDSATGDPLVDKDDDTDRDGCVDWKELTPVLNQGGIRDPWNPYDFYDVNHDGAVAASPDQLQVSQAFGVPANYSPRKDRGAYDFGPFLWNTSGPNGNISSGDVLRVSRQFGAPCVHAFDDLDPTGATTEHERYSSGASWPNGDRPWYCQPTSPCGGAAPHGIPDHGP